MDLREAMEQLFCAPLDAFVEVRTRLSGELSRAGKKEDSRALKQIRRPATSAWLTNQVVRRDRAAVEAFLAASDHLRESQGTMRDGQGSVVAYRSAAEAFRGTTAALTGAARQAARALGREDDRTLVDRVVSNVRAAALADGHRAALLAGQLSVDLDAGEAALLGLLGGTLAAGEAGAMLPARPAEQSAASHTGHEDRAEQGHHERQRERERERERRERHARLVAVALEEEATAKDSAVHAAEAAAEARAAHDAADATLARAEAAVLEARQAAQSAEARHREAARGATDAEAEAGRAAERRQKLQKNSD